MTAVEIATLVQAIATLEPGIQSAVTAAYNRIASNNSVTVRPLDEIFADTDATLQQIKATADAESK